MPSTFPSPIPGRVLAALLIPMLAAGCATLRPAPPPDPVPVLLDPTAPEINAEAPESFKVLFETTAGDFVVDVEAALAPEGARRFYNLVRNGYYDGVHFFRVVPGFVVQFGLSGEPEIAAVWREARIPDDPVRDSNVRGKITYAMGGPGSRTVQVYINLGDNSRLDDMGFAPFGTVTGGMDAVDRIHGGYGDGPPRGEGPSQGRIQAEGSAYLNGEFPLLDRVLTARIVREEWPEAEGAAAPTIGAGGH